MDVCTKNHLYAWIERHISGFPQQQRTYLAMMRVYRECPDLANEHGWTRVFQEARALGYLD